MKRIYHENDSVIKSCAKRLHKYVKTQTTAPFSIQQAQNITSCCHGYDSFKNLKANLCKKSPQLSSLDSMGHQVLKRMQMHRLKEIFSAFCNSPQLKPLSDIDIESLWMAMIPTINLHIQKSNERLTKIDQVAKVSYDWFPTDEDNEDETEYEVPDVGIIPVHPQNGITVKWFSIGVKCNHCNGTGKITPEIIEQEDGEPPRYSYTDTCETCEGLGIDHVINDKVNKIRLTQREYLIKKACDAYYDKLNDYDDDYDWWSTRNTELDEEDPEYNPVYDSPYYK